jgi:hypothetical protein|tara:strand:+ start:565 stop:828 length:264 start_codon:yes stop_codon:yes gene_type:complete
MGHGKSFIKIASSKLSTRCHGQVDRPCSQGDKKMMPTFVWSGEEIDRLETWWTERIELLIAAKKPLAASALFDEFQLERQSNYPVDD